MRSTKKPAEIVQPNGHIPVAESVDDSAPGDSLHVHVSALMLAGILIAEAHQQPGAATRTADCRDGAGARGRTLHAAAWSLGSSEDNESRELISQLLIKLARNDILSSITGLFPTAFTYMYVGISMYAQI